MTKGSMELTGAEIIIESLKRQGVDTVFGIPGGVNLPMLIKFVGHRSDKGLHELAAVLKGYGQKSIVLAGEMLKDRN